MSELEAREEPVPQHPQFIDPLPALRRTSLRAQEIARRTNTALVLARDGKILHVMPDGTESEVRR